MKIIGAGLAKTGTTSLAAALRILGFTVHDFIEHVGYHLDEYLEAFDGKIPDFVTMYKDIDAVTDTPPCFFWKELKESFPQAKVILTERDNVEKWVESKVEYGKRVGEQFKFGANLIYFLMYLTPTGRKTMKLVGGKIIQGKFAGDQPDKLPPIYLEHNSQVKASIPRDQLLVFNVKQGWEPLCEFLGVDVPDVPFPRLNKREDAGNEMDSMLKHSEFGRKLRNELFALVTIGVVVLGILVYLFVSLY